MSKDTGGPAFPHDNFELGNAHLIASHGITLRDWFATFAPQPRPYLIDMHQRSDQLKNPHNDSHKPRLRSRNEIVSMLRYEYADAMIAERNKP